MNYPPEIIEFLFDSRSRHCNTRKNLFFERGLRRLSHYYLPQFQPGNPVQRDSPGNETYKLIMLEGALCRSEFVDERKSKVRKVCLEYGESTAREGNLE